MTDFDIAVQTLVQSQIDLGTLKGNFALKTSFVCQRNCTLVICYFKEKHVICARNLQGQHSAKSVASAAQLNALQRLHTKQNKQHLVDAFSRPDYWLLNFQEQTETQRLMQKTILKLLGKCK